MSILKDTEFNLLRDFLYKKTGISLNSNKKALMFNRLRHRIETLKIESFEEYYNYLTEDISGTELEKFIDAITTNETFFFRDRQQFSYLSSTAIPEIIKNNKNGRSKRITIWSCASSTGEEPYTIAIAAMEAIQKHSRNGEWDLVIYASDINKTVLDIAKKGIYSKDKLKHVPPNMVTKYFDKGDNDSTYSIKAFVKGKMKFCPHNLKNTFFVNNINIIFCRNVMIYFDKESKNAVVTSLYRQLADKGYIFLSHTETIVGDCRFTLVAPSVFKKI